MKEESKKKLTEEASSQGTTTSGENVEVNYASINVSPEQMKKNLEARDKNKKKEEASASISTTTSPEYEYASLPSLNSERPEVQQLGGHDRLKREQSTAPVGVPELDDPSSPEVKKPHVIRDSAYLTSKSSGALLGTAAISDDSSSEEEEDLESKFPSPPTAGADTMKRKKKSKEEEKAAERKSDVKKLRQRAAALQSEDAGLDDNEENIATQEDDKDSGVVNPKTVGGLQGYVSLNQGGTQNRRGSSASQISSEAPLNLPKYNSSNFIYVRRSAFMCVVVGMIFIGILFLINFLHLIFYNFSDAYSYSKSDDIDPLAADVQNLQARFEEFDRFTINTSIVNSVVFGGFFLLLFLCFCGPKLGRSSVNYFRNRFEPTHRHGELDESLILPENSEDINYGSIQGEEAPKGNSWKEKLFNLVGWRPRHEPINDEESNRDGDESSNEGNKKENEDLEFN